MAISFLQFAIGNNGSGGTASATFTNPIAAGSVIAVATVADNGATFSFSDGHSDTPTDCGLGAINNTPIGTTIRVIAFLSPTTGAQTVTVTTSGTFCEVAIWEIAGLTGAVFDKAVFANNSGTGTPSSGSTGTLTSANEAAIGYGVGNGNYTAAGSGWTNDSTPTSFGNVTEHQVVFSTAAIAATASFTQIGPDSQMVCATFRSSGVAAVPTIGTQTANPVTALQRIPSDWQEHLNLLIRSKDSKAFGRTANPNPTISLPTRYQDWQQSNPNIPIIVVGLPTGGQSWSSASFSSARNQDWQQFNQNLRVIVNTFPAGHQYFTNPTLPFSRVFDWQDEFFLGLIGQDKLPFRQQDWKVPASPIKGQDWQQSYNNALNTVVVVAFPNVSQVFFVPSGPQQPTVAQFPYIQPPSFPTVHNTVYFVPAGPPPSPSFNSFIIPAGQDKLPAGKQTWTVPKGFVPPTLTWSLSPAVPPPFVPTTPTNQYNWPNPILRVPSDYYNWVSFLTNIPQPPPPPPGPIGGGIYPSEYQKALKDLYRHMAAVNLGRAGGISSGVSRRGR